MATFLLVAVLLSSSQLVRVAAYTLKMSPDHVRGSHTALSTSFTCNTGIALTGCQFIWRGYGGNTGPLLDLSRGAKSQTISSHLGSELTDYKYRGRGLGAGDCGVSLQVKGGRWWMVACRVRTETGGWTYAWSDLFTGGGHPLSHTLAQRESVVLPGGEARFMLKAQEPLSRCHIHQPTLSRFFDQGAESNSSTGRHHYLGGGLDSGECGVRITDISESDNGPVRGWIVGKADKYDHRYMALIVARPPSVPTLSVVYTNASVTATCNMEHGGRPGAMISWVLANHFIRRDSLDDSPANPQDKWWWPWMEGSVMQTLTLKLKAPKDSGKVLKCVVSHVTLAQPLEATEIISFNGKAGKSLPLANTGATARTTNQTSTTVTASPCNCTDTSALDAVKGVLSKLAEDQAKVVLDLAELQEQTKARMAQVALEPVKSGAIVEDETKSALEKVALEVAIADKDTKSMLAKIALDTAESSARAEKARAREQLALATNAEEKLKAERRQRGQLLPQLQSLDGVQG